MNESNIELSIYNAENGNRRISRFIVEGTVTANIVIIFIIIQIYLYVTLL